MNILHLNPEADVGAAAADEFDTAAPPINFDRRADCQIFALKVLKNEFGQPPTLDIRPSGVTKEFVTVVSPHRNTLSLRG